MCCLPEPKRLRNIKRVKNPVIKGWKALDLQGRTHLYKYELGPGVHTQLVPGGYNIIKPQGFHVWRYKRDAIALSSGQEVAIVPVYCRRKNVIAADHEEFVTTRLRIYKKDWYEVFPWRP